MEKIKEKLNDILNSLDYFNFHNKNLTKTQESQLAFIENYVNEIKILIENEENKK